MFSFKTSLPELKNPFTKTEYEDISYETAKIEEIEQIVHSSSSSLQGKEENFVPQISQPTTPPSVKRTKYLDDDQFIGNEIQQRYEDAQEKSKVAVKSIQTLF